MNLQINTAAIDISMQLNRMTVLVVFPDEERAKWYMDNCFEYYTRVLVVSMDGVYPYHHALKDSVQRLWNDPDTNIIVFGNHCIESDPPAGNVFSFDKWAIELCRKRSSPIHKSIAPLTFGQDPIMLARMIEIFSSSRNNRNKAGVNMYNIKEENYDWSRMPSWINRLIM
jgi:hypothetical protein